ncbi:hypothetical protein [Streptomyces sp. NPDC050485]|uniref:hypothetical protein n=1 Tax=Streptomyces sp. NPDC050485 TaxID=3365617 RepID=UPI0037B35ACA
MSPSLADASGALSEPRPLTPFQQAVADLQALGRTLPWSAEPMPGYTSRRPGGDVVFPDSPGYTPEQATALRAAWDRVRALSSHPDAWAPAAPGAEREG